MLVGPTSWSVAVAGIVAKVCSHNFVDTDIVNHFVYVLPNSPSVSLSFCSVCCLPLSLSLSLPPSLSLSLYVYLSGPRVVDSLLGHSQILLTNPSFSEGRHAQGACQMTYGLSEPIQLPALSSLWLTEAELRGTVAGWNYLRCPNCLQFQIQPASNLNSQRFTSLRRFLPESYVSMDLQATRWGALSSTSLGIMAFGVLLTKDL